jgi:hypothetical protein
VGDAEHGGVYVRSTAGHGFGVSTAGGVGVSLGTIGLDGFSVHSAGEDGVYVYSAGEDGLVVCQAGDVAGFFCISSSLNNGLEVGRAEHDGVHVVEAGDYGVYVGDAYYGVVVDSAAGDGVYANTTNAAGEWGFYTPDKIHGSNVTAASFSLVAQVAPGEALEPGQVVAAVGLGAPLPMSPQAVPLVALAQDPTIGLAGVVESRLVVTTGLDDQGNELVDLHSDPGTAGPGDYVLLTIAGVAYVRVAPEAAIAPGMRLAVSDGLARSLETQEINGMLVSEGAPTLGTALEANSPENPLIAVFVSLR